MLTSLLLLGNKLVCFGTGRNEMQEKKVGCALSHSRLAHRAGFPHFEYIADYTVAWES